MSQCNWDREQRAAAKREQRALLAVACDGCEIRNAITGRYEQTGLVSEADARMVFFFANAVFNGKSPEKALAEGVKARDRKPNKVMKNKTRNPIKPARR